MAYEMKNMAYWKAKNGIPGIDKNCETTNLADGRSPSSAFQQRENVSVESTDTHKTSSRKRGGKETTKSDFRSESKNTDLDTGTTYSTSTRDKQSTNKRGNTKSTNKQTFKETDASGNTLTKSTQKTNKKGVTRERGYTTDESGKKQRYSGKYRA